jgi:dTDP-4-dehydrorhamnose reductase
LVLGRSGQVACELAKIALSTRFDFAFVGREDCDLATADVGALIEARSPAAVVNAAAYTAVDRAEAEVEQALRLNSEVPAAAARACARLDLPFVHFSTDYVFDGSKPAPYLETDAVGPTGSYGRSKAAGEIAVLAAGGRATVLRTSWVYSAYGSNFVKTMLRLARDREEIGVVADQLGRPTWAEECARGAILAVEALLGGRREALGLFHLAGEGDATWADFAEEIFAQSAARGGPSARVRRISTAEFPTPASRPANSRLDTEKLRRTFSWAPGPWRTSLAACLSEMEITSR